MPRKQHTYHFIYRTTCEVTGNFYIGMHSTSNLEDKYIGSGKKLWLSIRKHGKEKHKFEILEFLMNRDLLKKREAEIVNEELLKNPSCMNMMEGGEGGFISDEQQQRRSSAGGLKASQERKKDPEKLKTHSHNCSENNKRMHSEGKIKTPDWLGRKHREETIEKFRIQRKGQGKGERNSQFGTVWIHNPDTMVVKKVKKEQQQTYFDQGWKKGRK